MGTTPLVAKSGQIHTVPTSLVAVGDIVLVKVDANVRRPMLITAVGQVAIFDRTLDAAASRKEFRISGTIFAEPSDHTLPAFRGAVDQPGDPAQIHGRPDRLLPLGYGEHLAPGVGLGQWIPRATQLPAGDGR